MVFLNMNHEGGCGLAALKTKNHEGGPAPAQPETKNHEGGAGGGCWSPAQNQEPIPGCMGAWGGIVQSDSDISRFSMVQPYRCRYHGLNVVS